MKDTCDVLRALPGWKAIVAMTADGGIGYRGGIPWHITGDLRLFKQLTLDQAVIAGRVTIATLPALPRRRLHGISRSTSIQSQQVVTWHHDFTTLPVSAWVIGGARIYRQLLPQCTAVVVTQVQARYETDTSFPTELLNEFGIKHTIAYGDGFTTVVYLKD